MTASATSSNAEIAALKGLAYLAGSEAAFARFIEVSGIEPAELRIHAGERDFLAGVLDFLLADDDLLLGFCEEEALDPKDIHMARHALSHG
jgi:hypothetical protein